MGESSRELNIIRRIPNKISNPLDLLLSCQIAVGWLEAMRPDFPEAGP
jgi:hypothetical protein